jgi:hypothetical protein
MLPPFVFRALSCAKDNLFLVTFSSGNRIFRVDGNPLNRFGGAAVEFEVAVEAAPLEVHQLVEPFFGDDRLHFRALAREDAVTVVH